MAQNVSLTQMVIYNNHHIDLGASKCNGYEDNKCTLRTWQMAHRLDILETHMTGFQTTARTSRMGKTIFALTAAAMLAGGLSGCTRIKDHEGFILDDQLTAQIQPGVDNKTSIEAMLGKPSFTGQFGANDYYYVSRELRHIAFSTPKANEQKVLRISFDTNNSVRAVDTLGMEQVASISPESDVTPSMGSNAGFFESIFDNIGAPGGAGGTAEGSADPTRR